MIKTSTLNVLFLLVFSGFSLAQSPQLQLQGNDISCFGDADGTIELMVRGGTSPYTYSLNGGIPQIINQPLVGWARASGGSSNDDRANSTAIHPVSGEVVITGSFRETAILGGSSITSNGGTDAFLAKFDAPGNLLWAISMGGGTNDAGLGVSLDALGNIYLSGKFSGNMVIGNQSINAMGNADIFMAKFNPNGNLIWVKTIGGLGSNIDFGALQSDALGHVYLTGGFENSLSIDFMNLTSAGSFDTFLAKFSPNGNLMWMRHGGGFGLDRGTGLFVDEQDHVYCMGEFQQSCGFGNVTVSATGGSDVFVARYDASGNQLWVEKAGGNLDDHGTDLTVVPNGNIVVTGTFTGSMNSGSSTANANGATDFFLLELAPSGATNWLIAGGGVGNEWSNAVASDKQGNLLVAGHFQNTLQVGGLNAFSNGGSDAFLLQLTPQGTPMALHTNGGPGFDLGLNVASTPAGNAVLVGEFTGSMSIGNIALSSQGGSDLFIAHYSGLTVSTTINNLVAGNYALTIQDNNGTSSNGTVSIAQPTQLVLNASTSDVNCNGGNDGSALASATGGEAPYQFSWSSGQTGALATNLSEGTYQLTVEDANGCIQTQNVVIGAPMVLQSNIVATQEIRCHGDANGQLEVSITGGVPPYDYLWSTGQTTSTVSNLAAGVYLATVTDANNNCAITLTYLLTEPDPIQVSGIGEDALCSGGQGGKATMVAEGGTAPYQYFWWNNETGATPQNLQDGVNSYELVDAQNCRFSGFIEIGAPAPLDISVHTQPVGRFGVENGNAKAKVLGGTPPYLYSWSNGLTGPLASGLAKGTYSLTVTDAHLCAAETQFSIREQVAVYPNPSRDVVRLTLDLDGNYNYELKLLTLDGREVYSEKIEGVGGPQERIIPVADLKSGVYLLQVISENELVINQRVVVE